MTYDALPPAPSDEALAAAQEMLPGLVALGELFRVMVDGDTHARMLDQLRTTAAAARESCEDARREWEALEAAKVEHAAAIERELRAHKERLVAEDKKLAADHEKREKAMKAREQWTAEQAAAAQADREKAAEVLADVERRLAMIRSAAG